MYLLRENCGFCGASLQPINNCECGSSLANPAKYHYVELNVEEFTRLQKEVERLHRAIWIAEIRADDGWREVERLHRMIWIKGFCPHCFSGDISSYVLRRNEKDELLSECLTCGMLEAARRGEEE